MFATVTEFGPGLGRIVMELHLFHVAPGAHSGQSYAHEGQEFIFVLSGRLKVKLVDQWFELGPGDSLCFESHQPHSFRNDGAKEATVLWINTPLTF